MGLVESNPANIRNEAWAAHGKGELARAERLYRQLLETSPDLRDAINLGALLRGQGRLKEASKHYHHWLGRLPFDLTLSLNAANCFRDLGERAEGEALLQRGLNLEPNNEKLKLALAQAWLADGQLGRSRSMLEELISANPQLRSAWIDLGVCHSRQGELEQALRAFEKAQELEPSDAGMAANRITVLKDLGRLEEAEQIITSLPLPDRNQKDLRGAEAGLLIAQNRMEDAAKILELLTQEEPQQPAHWLNWAACLRSLKYTVAPYQVLKGGLRFCPDHCDLVQALSQSLAEMGRQRQAIELWRRSKSAQMDFKDTHVFNLQFLGASYGLVSEQERASIARRWEEHKLSQGIGRLWPDQLLEPLEGRKLRVGYLSADFCNHPVGRFLLTVLQNHNRSEVEVWGLSCGPYRDWISEKLETHTDHWLDLRFLNDLQAARLIADERLDVLIELGGYTGHSRIGVLIQRPAPVQLSYLGYFAPTYLKAIDGWIGDAELFAGLTAEDRSAHALVEINGGYMAFEPGDLPLPERSNHAQFRFGSFNHARKLTPETVVIWCEVLNRIPNAELVLKSISFIEEAEQQRVRKLFGNGGIDLNRLILLPWIEGGLNHLQLYREMDVALDPIPYGGATTTAEALWMGVPVVCLAGKGMVGRLSSSLLTAANCSKWIAKDQQDFVDIAMALAAKGPRDANKRLKLRHELMASPLADGKRLSNELEKHYFQ
ncbi:MAG: tetratricopeptide repeat protein, partial [Bacteroidetes bacterium]|nr:tetratricopeptide repeat protein [Bacteroidota bacterium]